MASLWRTQRPRFPHYISDGNGRDYYIKYNNAGYWEGQVKIYKKPEMLGSKICQFYIDYFVIVLFMCSFGDFLFLKDVFNTNIWSWVNVITFSALIIIPYDKLLRRDYLKVNKYDLYKKEYKDCIDFTEDYERINPINQKEGKINYLKKLKEREIISETEYHNCLKDIYNINIMQVYYKTIKNNEKVDIDIKEYNDVNDNKISNNNEINKINSGINMENNKINNLINNASFASNENLNKNKKKVKKKKKALNKNPLNLNKLNFFNSQDIFDNIVGNNDNNNQD